MEKSVKRLGENRGVLGVRNRILSASRQEDGEGVPGQNQKGQKGRNQRGLEYISGM
jgi:hypothetical protein